MVRWWAALALALLVAGCASPAPDPHPVTAKAAPTQAPPRPGIVLSGSFTASGCLLPSLVVAAADGQLGDVQGVGSEAWGRRYTTASNATAAAPNSPLCVSWLDDQGRYVWSPTLGVVPENAAKVVVEADGQAVVSYVILIH